MVESLAGLPQIALQTARETLASLESDQESVSTVNAAAAPITQSKTMHAKTPQLDMFAEPSAIQNYVTKLNLDEISPREALQHLYELSALIGSSK